jgi:hypothetical protein
MCTGKDGHNFDGERMSFFGQFHQHITCSFCAKKVQTLNLSTKKLRAKLSHEKAARKILDLCFALKGW